MWATNKKYKRAIVLATALLFFVACNHKDKTPLPQTLLTETQMVDILTDTYLLEAELNYKKSQGDNTDPLQASYYQQLFDHYQIDDSIFQQNMTFYSYKRDALERIMDSVVNRIAALH